MGATVPKIWQLTSSKSWGGRESVPVGLHYELERRGIHSNLFCSHGSAIAARHGHFSGIEVLPFSGLLNRETRRTLARKINADRPEVVVCHFSRDLFLLRSVVRGTKKTRLVLVKHVGPGKPKKDPFHRWIYSGVDTILGVSEYIARRCRETYPIDPGRVLIWYPGVDSGRFRFRPEKRLQIRRDLGLKGDTILITYVARLTPGKGHQDLLAAFLSLAAHQENIILALPGAASPDEKHFADELRSRAQASSASERVIWPGYVENVSEWLCACDIFANPSPREAFGLNTIEAMATGHPVVGTTGGGTPEIITNEEDGLLVEPHNPDHLASALARLIESSDMRQKLGQTARTAVERRFALNKSVDRLLEAIL